MSEQGDVELYQQAVSLLQPGEAELVGIVVHTDFDRTEEPAMNELMLEVGERIAEAIQDDEMYVYAGDDDHRFGAGQFHGRRLGDDEFIWECQQLLRADTFDLVFYWERAGAHDAVVDTVTEVTDSVVPITEDGFVSR
ncbi:DUF5778 family protein [Halodesulfurarchaeum sp. HSR-GB]|uniref:DUF5778 family protein n=1 Tax=Halodesulfurarchaeum sp. HSR-GB TaxID=3074077 RepID=UPI00285AC049|nr:DUF5778 family protein [Halodesulfurarchaeum sp. HSR-GB]MDR5655768.1 DUF5778 family protein [Halodesulfurarchaeum sp. HSR-GB]